MSGPRVYFSLPNSHLFDFPPRSLPRPLLPPVENSTLRSPCGISPWIFHHSMRIEIPFVFAASYIFAICYINTWNRNRGNKPWGLTLNIFWKPFITLHNVFLAVYSLTSFLAMYSTLTHTVLGWNSPAGFAGVVDSLCQLHGPRGFGHGITYNTVTNVWESNNPTMGLDQSASGRIWSDGLAFWSWIFYLSKFYEVLDTFIIVAKGKESSTLQIYHHAGVIVCMWSGVRYMSPPVWICVLINSFIHTLMYTYFALAVIGVNVPKTIKRTLTTMQIMQFLVGTILAALHLFVQYDVPVANPYKLFATASASVASTISVVSSASVEVYKSHPVLHDVDVINHSGLPYDRIGSPEGSAQRMVQIAGGPSPGLSYGAKSPAEYSKVNCINTSGETFFIYLSLSYLFPLIVLFCRFFYKAYMKRNTRPRVVPPKIITDGAHKNDKAAKVGHKRVVDYVRTDSFKSKKNICDLT